MTDDLGSVTTFESAAQFRTGYLVQDSYKVLTIDDEPGFRENISDYLEDLGYTVVGAPDGETGWRMIENESPDLILCDLRMPKMNGLDFLAKVRESAIEIPIIIISGKGILSDAVLAMKLGAVDYLQKPIIDLDQLGDAVNRAFEKKYSAKFGKQIESDLTIDFGQSDATLNSTDNSNNYERALRESEARYRTIFESTTDAFLLLSDDQVIDCNKRALEIFRCTREALLGKSFYALSASQSGDEQEDYLFARSNIEMAQQGSPRIFEWHNRRLTGEVFTTEISLSRLATFENAPLLVVVRDTTERKRLENQLNHSQKMEAIGRLAAGVAHDFNNLITVIWGNAEIVKMRYQTNQKLCGDLDVIIETAYRATNLTRQLLVYSRKEYFEPKINNLNSVLDNLDKMLRRVIGEDIDLTIKKTADIGNTLVDAGMIEQAIVNICINARDAMPQGGLLTIKTRETNLPGDYIPTIPEFLPRDCVAVDISDTGTGIPKDILDKIFEPFFTTKDASKGTGLGLSNVYGIVKQNRGDIKVESIIRKGTTFTIYLPLATGNIEVMEEDDDVADNLLGVEKIMIVEDDKQVADLVQKMMKRFGYEITLIKRGDEALEILKESADKFDMVVSDVVLPKVSGVELAKYIREHNPDVKVLLISGYTDDSLAHYGLDETVHTLIRKPFHLSVLIKKIREMLDAVDA
ncbi:response regulator [bacterium]|nr:response regulator [bacterium]